MLIGLRPGLAVRTDVSRLIGPGFISCESWKTFKVTCWSLDVQYTVGVSFIPAGERVGIIRNQDFHVSYNSWPICEVPL